MSPWLQRLSVCFPFPRALLYPEERPLLSHWARGRRALVELGVFEGASAVLLRRSMASDGVLHLVDTFGGCTALPDLRPRRLVAFANVARVRNGRVRWHVAESHQAVSQVDGFLDLLFIDADHREEACWRDWRAWSPRVAPGGVVLFHDARRDLPGGEGLPGPTAVVNRTFRGPDALAGWRLVDEAGSLVVVERVAT